MIIIIPAKESVRISGFSSTGHIARHHGDCLEKTILQRKIEGQEDRWKTQGQTHKNSSRTTSTVSLQTGTRLPEVACHDESHDLSAMMEPYEPSQSVCGKNTNQSVPFSY